MNNEHNSFVELKFFPPNSSQEYLDSIPFEVKLRVVEKYYVENIPQTDSNIEHILSTFERIVDIEWMDPRPHSTKYAFWPSIRESLLEYYNGQRP